MHEIYSGRYDTAYESSVESDVMRVHDTDLFDLREKHHVYLQGIAHCECQRICYANRRVNPGSFDWP